MLSKLSTNYLQRNRYQISPAFFQRRLIHAKPKEYNGVNDIVYHFKKQDHFSYFLKYMMWTVFGSLALHLTWRKIDYREYKEKTQQKIQVMEEVAQCLEKGEGINESLRNEIKAVIRNELSLADEEEEEENNSILVKSKKSYSVFYIFY
jgi:hypothetical protein